MIYRYFCEGCELDEEITHSVKRCDDPTMLDEIRNKHCKKMIAIFDKYDILAIPTDKDLSDVKTKFEAEKLELCTDCKLRRVPFPTVTVTTSLFSSKTNAEKREILKKRSHDHFSKNLQDEFHQKNRRDYIP